HTHTHTHTHTHPHPNTHQATTRSPPLYIQLQISRTPPCDCSDAPVCATHIHTPPPLSPSQGLTVSGLFSVHLLSPRVRRLESVSHRAPSFHTCGWISFTGERVRVSCLISADSFIPSYMGRGID